ncbi:hypothetical protein [Spirillospora sp. NPDC047279]|uniref:hypothetical protein n=1 Tax=Spirillospora sp. NPDC047279 TaxID=3155478 RepID=UPI0033F5456E
MQWHFIITIVRPHRNGMAYGTFHGVFTPAPNTTRQDMYQDLVEYVRKQLDVASISDFNVVFFSAEPNELPRHLKAAG